MDRPLMDPLDAGTRTLDVEPFRGVRFSPAVVGDLARVTSPPYDVVDADGVLTLESADAHNVVRLILPRDDDCGPEGRYRHAAATLRGWLADGTLRQDGTDGLYVYEQARAGVVLQRGLIAAVALRDPDDRVVLAHEDTMPGPVADRLELMRAADANIEPIFLVYNGGTVTATVLVAVAATEALITAVTDDGIQHRLWSVSDPDQVATVRRELAGRTAMIADGHHRYAAYRALQAERRASDGPGPWDFGLALLVDLGTFPPAVGAIHRQVAGLSLGRAVELATAAGFVRTASGSGFAEGEGDPLAAGTWTLVDADGAYARLAVSDLSEVDRLLPQDRSAEWRSLDTAVLHHALIDQIWQAPDDTITYHHTVAAALNAVRHHGGLAVLMAPVLVRTVFDLAELGERMPRKSTSFGPKPRTGWVLRTFGP